MSRRSIRSSAVRRTGAAAVLVLATLLGSACGRTGARGEVARVTLADGRMVIGTLPSGPDGRLALHSLSRGGVYRWGNASQHFTGVPQVGDSLAVEHARADASLILRLHGWREASAGEEAQYELAVGHYERIIQWMERAPNQTIRQIDRSSCTRLPIAQQQRCMEAATSDQHVSRRSTETQVAFAVVRLSDQATAWWIAPDQKAIQRLTLEMIQRGSGGETAFGQ